MNANEQNKNNRNEEVTNVPIYLEQKGLLGILDNYLNGQKVKSIMDAAFAAVLEKAKEIAEKVPESLKDKVAAATEVFEEAGMESMVENVTGLFKQDLASHLHGFEGYIPTDPIAAMIKEAAESENGMDVKVQEIAESVASQLLDRQKEALVAFCLPEAGSEEEAKEIIDAVMGDEIPAGLVGIGIIIGSPFDDDEDEEEGDEE